MIAIDLFLDVDLRCGHDGLAELLRNKRISLSKVSINSCVIFINKSKTGAKLLSAGGVLCYAKFPKGITPASFDIFEQAFNGAGSSFSFDAKVRKQIIKALSGIEDAKAA